MSDFIPFLMVILCLYNIYFAFLVFQMNYRSSLGVIK